MARWLCGIHAGAAAELGGRRRRSWGGAGGSAARQSPQADESTYTSVRDSHPAFLGRRRRVASFVHRPKPSRSVAEICQRIDADRGRIDGLMTLRPVAPLFSVTPTG